MMAQPYRQHLGDSSDLVTPHDEVRAGFLALALERNRRATPAVKAAQHLKALASRATSPLDLLTMPDIQPALLTAAGVSDKAGVHLSSEDKVAAIQAFVEQYLEPAGRGFVEELVFRYLLTRGDALGGSMRNGGGLLAHRRFTRAVLAALQVAERPYVTLDGMDRSWMTGISNDADIENHCKAISWTT